MKIQMEKKRKEEKKENKIVTFIHKFIETLNEYSEIVISFLCRRTVKTNRLQRDTRKTLQVEART